LLLWDDRDQIVVFQKKDWNMANTPRYVQGYTLDALTNLPFKPVVAKRAPTTADTGFAIGTLWIEPKDTTNTAVNAAWILTSIISNSANWLSIQAGGGGGAGAFTTLTSTSNTALASGTGATFAVGNTTGTITIGGAAQTGAVNVGNSSGAVAVGIGNGTGANVVNIGTAGTGLVSIGNSTGGVDLFGTTISTGTIAATTFYATGDAGGIAATTAFTDGTAPAGGSGALTIISSTGSTAHTNAGFIKIYIGTTTAWIPYYTAID
jgi:hypothetical protein